MTYEYRDARHTPDGDIDCEINHPTFGWLPFTASASDDEEAGRELHAAILAAGDAAAYVPPPPEPVTGDDVNIERDRRIVAGLFVATTGGPTVAVQGRDVDQMNLTNLGMMAEARINAGDATPFNFRDAQNNIRSLTPAQMREVWQQSVAHVEAIYAASWALKDNPPIPQSYADDAYWP